VGEVVVEVPEADPAPAEGAAFAAGVATATAAVAAEGAAEAQDRSEMAQATAQTAAEVAYDARAELDSLRGELLARLDEIEGRTAATAALAVDTAEVVAATEVDDLSPEDTTPETTAEESESKGDTSADRPEGETHSDRKRYGSDRWFGDRD